MTTKKCENCSEHKRIYAIGLCAICYDQVKYAKVKIKRFQENLRKFKENK